MEEEPIEALCDLIAPAEAIAAALATQIAELESQLARLTPSIIGQTAAEEAPSGASAAASEARTASIGAACMMSAAGDAQQGMRSMRCPAGQSVEPEKQRRVALRVWKSYAKERLAQMASSLEAALASDSKLRALFDNMDADLGGTIDEAELLQALHAAGKQMSAEVVREMFKAADYDGGGDIDYSEFSDVIKGVKAAKAAFVIERGIRRYQVERSKPLDLLSAAQLETQLGACLLRDGSPAKILLTWDRTSSLGAVSKDE